MILIVDIGNSNIKFTTFHSDEIVDFFTLKTDKTKKNYDELRNKIEKVDGIILSSVVPELTDILKDSLSFFKVKIVSFTDEHFKLNIKKKPSEKPDFVDRKLGQDMLADISYGLQKYKNNFLTVDLGTAAVINAVNQEGIYVGSTIFPGLASLSKYMSVCSQLKDFDVEKQETILSGYPMDAMNGGVFWGGIGMLEKNIAKAAEDANLTHPNICITGGFFELIKDFVNFQFDYDKNMTAKGLYEIYKINV
jgi:type III pantothenate kinase